MSLMPGWYQTSKALQFKAIDEFAINRLRLDDNGLHSGRSGEMSEMPTRDSRKDVGRSCLRILDRVTGSDPSVTDYILEEPAKCPNCRRYGILEKTLVEPV
jgi:hypothetical protein